MFKRGIDWIALALGFFTLAIVMTVVSIVSDEDVRAIEENVFDQYQRWKPRQYDPSVPVRVIDIDEDSLRELGQWPWPRFYLAELVRRLTNAGAATITFDVVFAEPDRTSPLIMAQSYRRFGEEYEFAADGLESIGGEAMPDHDEIFGWMISQTPVVLGTIATDLPQTDLLPPQPKGMAVSGDGGDISEVIEWYQGATVNLPSLSQDALGVGVISLAKDDRGIVRRVPLAVAIGDNSSPYAALSIEALRVAQGARSFIVKTSRGSGETDFSQQVDIVSIKVGNAIVPLDADGALRVHYSGARDQRVIPAHEVLAPGGLPEELANDVAGKILFVGSSAQTLFDIRRTPLHDRISGVHVHAEIVEQIFQESFIERPDWSIALERALMVICGLLVVFFVGNTMPVFGFAALIVSLGVIGAGSWFAFSEMNLLLSPVAPVAGVVLPHFVVSGFKYFTSEANRREVTRQFEHFVSPDVIEDILDNPEQHLTPGGALRTLSIMFLDVRRFSTITEKMEPQQVISFINELLTPLTDVILENEGTIDKYMGDAVMAFWNAPRQTPDHEIKSVRAMMAFNGVLDDLKPSFDAQGIPLIEIGTGINTGECSVGNMGSLKRLAYSCLGDSVNLAARLEGQTKGYGVRNLVGSATALGAKSEFGMFELDSVAVKGRSQPERIFTVAGDSAVMGSVAFQNLSDRLATARTHFLAQEWDASEAAFRQAAELGLVGVFDPHLLAEIMIQRIEDYRTAPPPPDWDGVYVATSK